MDVVWIKLNTIHGTIGIYMFGTGGVTAVTSGETTSLWGAVHIAEVQESVDEIMELIGSARNGVKVGANKEA
jgi:hypothetical protein